MGASIVPRQFAAPQRQGSSSGEESWPGQTAPLMATLTSPPILRTPNRRRSIGWEMDRWNPHKVMMHTLLAAGVFTTCLGNLSPGVDGLMALCFLLGFCINSSNTVWTVTAAGYYPTEMRASRPPRTG